MLFLIHYCSFHFLESHQKLACHVKMGLKRRQRIQQSFIVSRTVYICVNLNSELSIVNDTE